MSVATDFTVPPSSIRNATAWLTYGRKVRPSSMAVDWIEPVSTSNWWAVDLATSL